MSRTKTAARSLARVVASPITIAERLAGSNASILSICISRDSIDLAVASHPCSITKTHDWTLLARIPLVVDAASEKEQRAGKKGENIISPAALERLEHIVLDRRVRGSIIHWPVQDEGRCGAACARVLNALDQIVAQSDIVFNVNRPLCLWDYRHCVPQEDEWGRSTLYSRRPAKSDRIIHRESRKHVHCVNALAADIWNDFCQSVVVVVDSCRPLSYGLALAAHGHAGAGWIATS